MTTFTSDDREEAYKKIVVEAPYQPGYEDAVPIPFAGWVSQELTNEEIMAEWEKSEDVVSFARAILRKAQGK